MKILLLDIDYTLLYGNTPWPYLKEFLTRLAQHYTIRFYTAGDDTRITDLCRVLYHQLGMRDTWIREANAWSLSRTNCPMITQGNIEIKCLRRAATVLHVDYEQIAYLLDDMPMHDNPDKEKRVQVPGFWGGLEDTFLRDFDYESLS